MPDQFALERRITLRLLAYWEKIRADRAMPAEQDIRADDIQDLWESCFLLKVRDSGEIEDQYSYIGREINEAYRQGMPETSPGGLLSPRTDKFASGYGRVITTCKPVLEEGEFRNLQNDLIKYRQCLLPLGDGAQVQAIFGGMRFKIFPNS